MSDGIDLAAYDEVPPEAASVPVEMDVFGRPVRWERSTRDAAQSWDETLWRRV